MMTNMGDKLSEEEVDTLIAEVLIISYMTF
jgi:hypothetical protein